MARELLRSIETTVGDKTPRLRDALARSPLVDEGALLQAAAGMLRKATPAEREAIETIVREPQLYGSPGPVYETYSGFLTRVKRRAVAVRLIKKREHDLPLKDFDQLYADLTLHAQGELPAAESFHIGRMKIVLVADPLRLHEVAGAVYLFKSAYDRLKRKKLDAVWYGTSFILAKSGKRLTEEEKEAYARYGYNVGAFEAAAFYHSGGDVIHFHVLRHDTEETIIHELGHRYWSKFMTPRKRTVFNSLVQSNVESIRDDGLRPGPGREDYSLKPIAPVSDYGKSSIEEAFAEAFMYYVFERDMTAEQVRSLKLVMARAV